jgi:hypothetical protein
MIINIASVETDLVGFCDFHELGHRAHPLVSAVAPRLGKVDHGVGPIDPYY